MQEEKTGKDTDEVFCSSCGSAIKAAAEICPKCGVRNMAASAPKVTGAKDRLTYILLGIFLGCLGIHNFYAGYTGRGVAQLLITILSCGFGGFISMIWAIIEICVVTEDASGRPLR